MATTTEFKPSANGHATVTKKRTAKQGSAKKVTRKRTTKAKIMCPICSENGEYAGPFKSQSGLAIHNGKPQFRASHLGDRGKAETKVTNKVGKIVDGLVDKWFDEAVAYKGEARQLLIACARELMTAFSK